MKKKMFQMGLIEFSYMEKTISHHQIGEAGK